MGKAIAERADAALAEFASIRSRSGDEILRAIEAAIFLEESFDIDLTDEDIAARDLGETAGMRRLLDSKLRAKGGA